MESTDPIKKIRNNIMEISMKVIKIKDFEANGDKHKHFVVAYKGRVFGFSTLRFEKEEYEVKEGVLTIKTEIEVLKHVSTDPLTGEVRNFIDIVPKSGLVIAEF